MQLPKYTKVRKEGNINILQLEQNNTLHFFERTMLTARSNCITFCKTLKYEIA